MDFAARVADYFAFVLQLGTGIGKLRSNTKLTGTEITEINLFLQELNIPVRLMHITHDAISSIASHERSLHHRDLAQLLELAYYASYQQAGRVIESLLQDHQPVSGQTNSRKSPCRCDFKKKASGRFWAFEYTLRTPFRQVYPTCRCHDFTYGASVTIAFFQSWIGQGMTLSARLVAASGRFSLLPSLDLDHIVSGDSVGINILFRARQGLITLEEARDGLTALQQTDPTFRRHVTLNGLSYLEVLLAAPFQWGREEQFALLEFMVRDLGVTRGTDDPRFITQCAKWIGEGPHLDLLEVLFENGLDIAEPDFQNWPEPCSPDWISEALTPDPFFIEYLSILCNHNPGVFAMSPLHEAVALRISKPNSALVSQYKDRKNCLGQTALHFAVLDSGSIDLLISSGCDMNACDNYGHTPLMYAAAMAQEESVMRLLEAGADPHARDHRFERSFLHYAMVRKNWQLVLRILDKMDSMFGKQQMEIWKQYAAINFLCSRTFSPLDDRVSLHNILSRCMSPDFLCDDLNEETEYNCLLHHVRSVEDVDIFLNYGTKLVNHANSHGQRPIMLATRSHDHPDLIRCFLKAGADINLKDKWHRNVLAYMLQKLRRRDVGEIAAVIESLCILLDNGVDVRSRDLCRCSCAPGGCLPAAAMYQADSWIIRETPAHLAIWSLEWCTMLLERRGIGEAKQALASLIRKGKHEELDMTHVCCGRRHEEIWYGRNGLSPPLYLPDDDIKDILDEESTFNQKLDEEMEQLLGTPYVYLLETRVVQVKQHLSFRMEEAARHNSRVRASRMQNTTRKTVSNEVDVDCSYIEDPVRDVASDVARYIYWMEGEYHLGSASSLNTLRKRRWYMARFSWLRHLITTLSVPIQDIFRHISLVSNSNVDSGHLRLPHDKVVLHFRKIWHSY